MSYQKESFGMMDEGYFVPRTEILDWLNSLLNLGLTKIEQLGSGAVYCQVIDVIHPGKVAMNKLNWKAKNDYEFISNLKILQNAFDKIGIKRHVEVEKLAKAKYQDNLQFIQWLKRYYDINCGERGNNYLADERRNGAVIDFSFAEKNVVPKTYNGSGVIYGKKDLPEAKKKDNSNIKSSVAAYRNDQRVLEPKIQTNNSIVAKKGEKKNNDEEIKLYKNRINDLEVKLEMITEIAKSSEDSEQKMRLIEDVLQIKTTEIDQEV